MILFLILLTTLPLSAQLIFSEVMFDLAGSDSPNEFVEIYNDSPDSIDLSLWKIRDKFSTDELVDGGMGTTIAPKRYALIFEGDYDPATGIYLDLIPDSVLVVRVDDNSIGNGLSSADSLFLTNSSSTTSDSVGWADISASGFSYERKRLNQPNTTANWATSLDSLGTPGFVNSVAPPLIEAVLITSSLSHTPDKPTPNDVVTLLASVRNEGINPISGTVMVSEKSSIVGSTTFSNILDGDSALVNATLGTLSPGQHLFNISLFVAEDADTTNNHADYSLAVRFTERVLTFNEIHYSPVAGMVEFIELAILDEGELDLSGWYFSDSDTSNLRAFPEITGSPGNLIVVSSDSTLLPYMPLSALLLVSPDGFPTLNNSGDDIFLFDPTRSVIDSLSFTDDWGGGDGRSLEKLNPKLDSPKAENWGTCTAEEKMTPGENNSILVENLPEAGTILLDPNPFSPDGDGFDEELRITYSLPFAQAYITILVFDSIGREVRTLARNLISGAEGILIWDGHTDSGIRARIGMYILKVEAVDQINGQTVVWIKTVVLAETLR
ncbi:MAG: lamin tail domain-containing protein [Fidelibacterota bacterium]